MKRNVFLTLLVTWVYCSMSAVYSQNSLWSLAPAYLNQNAQPLPTGNYTGAPAQFAHNAMHDAQGNLLFFVVDGRYYFLV
jgi:hypothetical protein